MLLSEGVLVDGFLGGLVGMIGGCVVFFGRTLQAQNENSHLKEELAENSKLKMENSHLKEELAENSKLKMENSHLKEELGEYEEKYGELNEE